ncbi:hypothetical protein [Aeromicrobium sp. IC_218]|uniref:hypothetical protein n=1 Tax=Aeromicrobium sp. IC_218 TaxID=2545468 RepID=UPI0010394603|nr:hypothetical protein [Aeromicrobium sp. IC_218]TCI98641.1 hypothetical protein E0W78_09710 [Aeromicrobium sp. IC_218]
MLQRTPPGTGRLRTGVRSLRSGPLVLGIGLLAVLVRLPRLDAPLSPDEGGFLMVAAQWAPGSSLYGDYWVDRPPLLMGIFAVADALGGSVPLRLLGAAAVLVSVLLAGRVAALVAPGRPSAPVLVAVVVAALASTPLHGAQDVNGELLAMPFVLAGLLALVAGTGPARSDALAWAAAGVLAACAVTIKQSVVEVVVAALVAAVWVARRRPREALRLLAAGAAGAVVTLGLVLGWAASRGTGPLDLWDATVLFRIDAGRVIQTSSTSATDARAAGLVLAFVASGAAVVAVACLLPRRGAVRRPSLPLVLALAVLVTELVVVAGGGSYWRHYLVGTVPGLALLLAATLERSPRPSRLVRLAVTGTAASALVALVPSLATAQAPTDDDRLVTYLHENAGPEDTAVTAFGNPALLREAGLTSPYEHLWSLPVRVRDPRLDELRGVLERERPTWVLVSGPTLRTWGVDAAAAQIVLDRDYAVVAVIGDRYVYRVRA